MSDDTFGREAQKIIDVGMSQLRELGFDDVVVLPEAEGEERTLADRKCIVTTYVQSLELGNLLVTVQVARRTWLGMANVHFEGGLVFTRDGRVREATSQELMDSGG